MSASPVHAKRDDHVNDLPAPAIPLPTDQPGRTALILDIVAKETGVSRDRLALDQSLAALEVPSLDMVQTVFELESRFGIEIPVISSAGNTEFETVGDLVAQVLAAIGAQDPV
jgi:acyl carrier protein